MIKLLKYNLKVQPHHHNDHVNPPLPHVIFPLIASRINSVKQNLSTAIRYIENEKAKCDLGETIVMGTLPCASLQNPSTAGIALARHLFNNIQTLLPKHVNPHDTDEHFFPIGGGVSWEKGQAFMSGSGNQIQINTCLADPCTETKNQIQTFINAN